MEPEQNPEWLQHRGDEPHLLRDLLRTYQLLMGSFPQENGVSASHFLLFRELIHAYPKPLGTMALARRMKIDPAAISRQLQLLERKKWIERIELDDRRRNAVKVTAAGKRAFVKIHTRTHRFEELLRQRINESEMNTTIKVLAAICSAIEEHQQ